MQLLPGSDSIPIASSHSQPRHLARILGSRFIACVACLHLRRRGRCLDLETAAKIVHTSRTAALVYHVPREFDGLQSFGWSFADLLDRVGNREHYVLVANTARAASTDEAIRQAFDSRDVFLSLEHSTSQTNPVIKLEVLRENLTTNDAAVVAALRELVSSNLDVIPLVSPTLDAVRSCANAGATVVRILTGRIGSLNGISQSAHLRQLVSQSPVPLFFEGGISSPDDVAQALDLGAAGVLVNTAFHESPDPVALCASMRYVLDKRPECLGDVPTGLPS